MLMLHGGGTITTKPTSTGTTTSDVTSWSKAPTFAGDPVRRRRFTKTTRRDCERYLSGRPGRVDCRFCHVSVRVKNSGPHTAVQWSTESQQRCAYFAEIRAAGGSSARTPSCPKLSDSIKHAVAEGCPRGVLQRTGPGDG